MEEAPNKLGEVLFENRTISRKSNELLLQYIAITAFSGLFGLVFSAIVGSNYLITGLITISPILALALYQKLSGGFRTFILYEKAIIDLPSGTMTTVDRITEVQVSVVAGSNYKVHIITDTGRASYPLYWAGVDPLQSDALQQNPGLKKFEVALEKLGFTKEPFYSSSEAALSRVTLFLLNRKVVYRYRRTK